MLACFSNVLVATQKLYFCIILVMNYRIILLATLLITNICSSIAQPLSSKPLLTNPWGIRNWVSINAPSANVGITRSVASTDWQFYIAIALAAFIGIVNALFGKYIQVLPSLLQSNSLKSKQLKDQLVQNKVAALLLNILFVISAATLIYLIVMQQNSTAIGAKYYYIALIAFVITIAYLLKYVSVKLVGWLCLSKSLANQYIFSIFYFNKLMALLFVPAVVLLLLASNVYFSSIVTVVWFIAALLLVFRYFTAYKLAVAKSQVSSIYILLYICTLEVLPLLLLYKAIIKNGNYLW